MTVGYCEVRCDANCSCGSRHFYWNKSTQLLAWCTSLPPNAFFSVPLSKDHQKQFVSDSSTSSLCYVRALSSLLISVIIQSKETRIILIQFKTLCCAIILMTLWQLGPVSRILQTLQILSRAYLCQRKCDKSHTNSEACHVSELSRVSSGLGHVRVSPPKRETIAERILPTTKKETKCLMGLWIFEATCTTFGCALLPINWKTHKSTSFE